jgi:hypothetical protein
MATSSTRWVARALWLAPAFLVFICAQQIWAAYTIGQTIARGTPATAQVTKMEQSNRVDVTYDYMSLRVALPGGDTLTKERMSVSHTLVPLLEDKKQVAVWVRPGAAQEVVIRERGPYGQEIGRKQRRIAVVQAAMSGLAALMFGFGVFWWNRYLRRRGDPSAEPAGQREEDYSAGRRVRDGE